MTYPHIFFDTSKTLLIGCLLYLTGSDCVKSVRIPSYSGPDFPAFGLNTERYYAGKIWTRITPNTDNF